MSLFTKLGNEIASPVDAAGNPRAVENVDMQRWMTEVERATLAFQAGGGIIFPDKATMDGTLTYAANQMAWVMGDATAGNNGIYRKVGASGSGSWVRLGDLPFSFIMATNAGAGTPDAIVATSSLPVPAADGAALISVNIVADNTTAPVTVAFNGGPVMTIKTMSGNDVAPGGLKAGMIVTGFKSGSTFRLVTDQASAAIQAAAEAARDAALSAVPNAFPEDRTALKALDTNSITAAYLKEAGWEGQWLWDASVPVATHQADTLEQRYIAPDADEDGAWVRAASVPTGGFWSTDTVPGRVVHAAYRLLAGDEAANDGSKHGTVGSWLYQQGAGTSKMSWIVKNAQIAGVTSTGAIGVTGAARTLPGNGSALGIIGYAANNAGEPSQPAWGAYLEGVRAEDSGSTWGLELNITNLAPSPAGEERYTPYGSAGGPGTTFGIMVASGGDPAVNPVTYDADVGIVVSSNGAKFYSGIVITAGAVRRDNGVTGRAHGLLLPYDTAIEWYHFNNGLSFSLVSAVTDDTHKQEIMVNNSGMTFYNASGGILFRAQWMAGSTNFVDIAPQTGVGSPAIRAQGDAANLSLRAYGKGTGGVILADGAAVTKVQVNATGIGFFGSAPVARPTGVTVDAASIHAALVSLGLIAA